MGYDRCDLKDVTIQELEAQKEKWRRISEDRMLFPDVQFLEEQREGPFYSRFFADCLLCGVYKISPHTCPQCPLIFKIGKLDAEGKEVYYTCYHHSHPYKKWQNQNDHASADWIYNKVKEWVDSEIKRRTENGTERSI